MEKPLKKIIDDVKVEDIEIAKYEKSKVVANEQKRRSIRQYGTIPRSGEYNYWIITFNKEINLDRIFKGILHKNDAMTSRDYECQRKEFRIMIYQRDESEIKRRLKSARLQENKDYFFSHMNSNLNHLENKQIKR